MSVESWELNLKWRRLFNRIGCLNKISDRSISSKMVLSWIGWHSTVNKKIVLTFFDLQKLRSHYQVPGTSRSCMTLPTVNTTCTLYRFMDLLWTFLTTSLFPFLNVKYLQRVHLKLRLYEWTNSWWPEPLVDKDPSFSFFYEVIKQILGL